MQKNSWRSLDSGGNGYLNVYEGGAPSSRRIREGGYIYLSQVYINRPGEAPEGEEGGQGSMWKLREDAQGGCETDTPPSPPPEKGANGRSEASALSLTPHKGLLSSSLLKPKYNGQSNAIPFLNHSTRHIGRAHVNRRRDKSRHLVYLDDVESESIGRAKYPILWY